jgi:predicted HAD superfamily phosphohydrolase
MLGDGMAYMEQFASTDLVSLRDELFQSGLDSWQVAELIGSFLAAHGYGVSHDDVRSAALSLQFLHGSIQEMQAELERLALPM